MSRDCHYIISCFVFRQGLPFDCHTRSIPYVRRVSLHVLQLYVELVSVVLAYNILFLNTCVHSTEMSCTIVIVDVVLEK